jgi:3-hydroxybutyryl-CoA dehydrogenase
MIAETAVIGAGLMGGQIALVLAMGSEKTFLMSRRKETIDKTLKNIRRYAEDLNRHGMLRESSPSEVTDRIHPTVSIEEACRHADLVVESITEDIDMKRDVFTKLDHTTCPDAILSSNTSGLPVSKLAEVTRNPDRVVGSHFIQPAHIVPIVEIVKGEKTSEETLERSSRIWRELGKTPLLVRTDIPGFIVNRIQHAMIREAVFLLSKGVAKAEDIDLAVTLGLGPRFTISGPLEQRDINGIDMNYRVARHLWRELSSWEEPLGFLKEKVDRGELGLSVGKGYYDWCGRDPAEVRRVRDDLLIRRIRDVTSWKPALKESPVRSL